MQQDAEARGAETHLHHQLADRRLFQLFDDDDSCSVVSQVT